MALALGPNPMRADLTIDYALPADGPARVTILDVQGREVAQLASGFAAAGRHRLSWSGASRHGSAAAGVYFVRFEAEGRVLVRRFARVQ
jgi:hypothetical protein